MDLVDGSEHFEDKVTDQSPSLLTIILDTNPLAWTLLENTLPLSSAVSNLLVFINAHLACNYTNRVAVIASHVDKAQWLYPTPTEQLPPQPPRPKSSRPADQDVGNDISSPLKRLKVTHAASNGNATSSSSSGNKYRPFRIIESELLINLTKLLSTTAATSLQHSPSTQIAGALTLALSYTNRLSLLHSDNPDVPQTTTSSKLQSRILLLSASPSTDLAHQYIPIMNSIFACQRLSVPIDILQLPLPAAPTTTSTLSPAANPTVFLQQASDATNGIFIPFQLPTPPSSTKPSTSEFKTACSESLLTYLLTSFLPSPSTRLYLTPPTLINVDFRAACFCHRRVIDLGYVCSICLSIFCSPPDDGVCLTCGNQLTLGTYGKRPVVIAKKKKKKKRITDGASAAGTPTPA